MITLSSLSGSNWSLVRLNGKPILPETYISARFDEAGTVSGSAGCNRYRASYEVAGSGLTVGAAASTMMACLPPLMEQEKAYLTALAATVSYELSGDTLLLKNQAGATVAQFSAEPQGLAGTTWNVTGYNNGVGRRA